MFGAFKAARKRYTQTQTAQQELVVAFNAIGTNFMHLHPLIHRALLMEAIMTGTEATMEKYIELVTGLEEYEGGTDDQKANVLLELYRARGQKFADATQAQVLADGAPPPPPEGGNVKLAPLSRIFYGARWRRHSRSEIALL